MPSILAATAGAFLFLAPPTVRRIPRIVALTPSASVGREPAILARSKLTRINIEGWRALKVLAAEQETTLNALAVEAFNDLLKKHGKRQSVENPLLD